MQERECMIVRDLLPSYIEQLLNGTSVSFIETHLQECKGCEKRYRELLLQYEEENSNQGKAEKRFFRRLRRYRYQMLGGLIGMLLPFVAVAGWFGFKILQNRFLPTPVECTEDVADYGEFKGYKGPSKLALFPEEKELDETVIQSYVYECDKNSLYQECQIYLECQYTEAAYGAEKERLQEIVGQDTGLEVVYSEKDFAYPAVYAMLNSESCNEYALFLEDEYRIIYVYLQGMVDRRELYFEEKYLPLEYGQHGMEFEDVEAYSIYQDKNDF